MNRLDSTARERHTHVNYPKFGNTGLEISEVVFGGGAELKHLRLAIAAAEMGLLPDAVMVTLNELADTNFGRLGQVQP